KSSLLSRLTSAPDQVASICRSHQANPVHLARCIIANPHRKKHYVGRHVILANVSEKLVDAERVTSADIFNAPAERAISQGRLLLCALAILAMQFAPIQPMQSSSAIALVLLAYFAFAAILVAVTRYRFLGLRARHAIHVADIIVISVLLLLADGSTSLFFVFFTLFVMLAATMRWQWQAVIATALALTLASLFVEI